MKTIKKLVFFLSLYFFSVGIASAIDLTPNPIQPNKPYNIEALVRYLVSLEPVSDAFVTFNVSRGNNVDCTNVIYPQNQQLNYFPGSNDIYCTGNNCQVEMGTDPNSPSAEGNYTICVNASKTGFSSSYSSAILTVNASALCGNGVIDPGENCQTCPADAGCFYGTQCCGDGTCKATCTVPPTCSNNGCRPPESCSCPDCANKTDSCTIGEICNSYTSKCYCNQLPDGICPVFDPACVPQDPDCIGNVTAINVSGGTDALYIIWNFTGFIAPQNIGMQCYLNCDPRILGTCGGAQSCNYIGPTVSNSCQIQKPNYYYDNPNLVVCRLYDPPTNANYSYFTTSFLPYNVNVLVSNFTVTVGQDFSLPITIRNTGLFTDSYNVTLIPSNLIYVPYTSQLTSSLAGIPVFSTQQLLFYMKSLALSSSPAGILMTANSTTNSTHGIQVYIQLQASSASLPEFDIFGVLQIILLSSVAYILLILKRK